MPVIACLPGAWPLLSEYNNAVESNHDYPAITQPPKAQVHVEVKHLVDKSVQTDALGELTVLHVNQELEQQDDSGSRQKSSSNQPSKNQSSRQNKSSRNEKGYESGSSEGDDEQINDNNGDDGDDDHDDRRRRGYEASDETSNDDDDDDDQEYTEDEEEEENDEDEPTPPPPTSRKRKTRAEEESRRYKTLKRRRGEQRQEDDDESEPMKKRSRPEKSIIHEYYREIGRSGKDEFRMEDLFDEYEIKVIHDFLSEIGKMRSRRRQPSQKREGNGRRTSGKQKSSRSGGRLERKHSDIYDSFSKQDQALIHNYYQQIGHKGGKYRGSDVDEDELDEEDRKVHPGFLKEKRKRQQNVVHEFLSKVAKQKRWGQAPTSGGTSGKQQSTGGQKRDKTGKMRSGGGPREM